MASKTVWLNVYPTFVGMAHRSELDADINVCDDRIGPAVQVDLIRTPEGWKQDGRAGRIEGLKEALNLVFNEYWASPEVAQKRIEEKIAQLEQELAQ